MPAYNEQHFTSKKALFLQALFTLQLFKNEVTKGAVTFWQGRALETLTGSPYDWHAKKLLEELCENKWVERIVVGNAYCYRLTPNAFSTLISYARHGNMFGHEVPVAGLFDE